MNFLDFRSSQLQVMAFYIIIPNISLTRHLTLEMHF